MSENTQNSATEAEVEKEATQKKEQKSKALKKEAVLLKEIEALKEEIATQKDTYLRLCAEYDNFRKRTAKEKADIYSSATSKAVLDLLPVLDNFERAQAAQGENADAGFAMIFEQFKEYLTRLGVCEMKAQGEKFDPNLHIAVMHVDDESLGESVVIEVFQKGYTLSDKVIRPACVKVAN